MLSHALPVVRPPPVPARDYLSYSALALYWACPLRYYYRYVVGMPERTVAANLAFGGAFHSAVQHQLQHWQVHDTSAPLDVLFDVFWDAWNRRTDKPIEYARGEDVNTIARLIDRMLPVFLASELARPKGRIIGIEEELRAAVIPGCPDLLARLDLVVDTGDSLVVIDFKTARSRWNAAKLAESAPQLLLYGRLAATLCDNNPLQLAFAVITKAKRQPSLTLHSVTALNGEIQRTLNRAANTWNSIQQAVFEPRPSPVHCPRCPFWTSCPAWRGPRR